MINEKFIFIGALLSLIGSITYALDTLKGQTQPNRVTWFIWAMTPMIVLSAQLQQSVGLQALLTFVIGFGPLLVFIASFLNKKAFWKVSRLDIACGVLSILALMLWWITGEGNVAIAFSIVADFLAAVPTLIKSYRHPESEHSDFFRNDAISAIITLLTIKVWTFAHYGFAINILLICATAYIFIRFKVGTRRQHHA